MGSSSSSKKRNLASRPAKDCFGWLVSFRRVNASADSSDLKSGESVSRRPGGVLTPHLVRYLEILAVLILVGLFIVFLREAWLGISPFGSDNDEYRMVAEELNSSGRPVVAGVEGTKYPLGYPIVLVLLGWLTPSATTAGLVLNVALMAGTATALWWALRTWGPLPAFAATAFFLINPSVWRATSNVMPDVAMLGILAAGLVVFRRKTLDEKTVVAATVLGMVAVSIKSIGLLVAVAASVALWRAGGKVRQRAWMPTVGAGFIYGIQSLWIGRYPAHTTGYSATFFLENVNDYSKGTVGIKGVLARIPKQLGPMLDDVADAVVAPQITASWVVWLAVALLALALLGRGHIRVFIVGFAALHASALLVWPYQSDRLQMPMLMVAAVGVAAGVTIIQRIRPIALGAVALAVPLVAFGYLTFSDQDRIVYVAGLDHTSYSTWTENVASFDEWARVNIPADGAIASLDYREIGYRVDRRVVALGYSKDTDALLEATLDGDAEWFVQLTGLYGRRTAIAQGLIDAHPDTFELVFQSAGLDVYHIKED